MNKIVALLLACLIAAPAFAGNTRRKGEAFSVRFLLFDASGSPVESGTPVVTINSVASANAAAFANGYWSLLLTTGEADANEVVVLADHPDGEPVLLTYAMYDPVKAYTDIGLLAADLKTLLDAKASQTSMDATKADTAAIVAVLPSDSAKMAGEGETAKNLDQVEGDGGGGTVIPVNQVVVPKARMWTLVETDSGLVDETKRTLQDGDTRVFAVDFRNALPTNGQLGEVNSVAIASGTMGGVTFASSETDPGVDKTQAKVSITGVTPGTYEIAVNVDIAQASGGGTETGVVTLVVGE